jgi:1-acyl-sn-glycerol-3-phosphate acyltransferase
MKSAATLHAHEIRLAEDREQTKQSKRWGPDLSKRQWATLRAYRAPDHISPHAHGAAPATMPGQTGALRGMLRLTLLAFIVPIAIADAARVRIVTHPSGAAMAHARAAWLHRWSRVACRVLGIRIDRRGFVPVSGVIVANHTSLLDALVIAAIRPVVFVACAEIRRIPIVGFIARIAGTIFIEGGRRNEISRVNFMVQRTLRRREVVVIFPECDRAGEFASALFQPAAELGCTLTAAAISYSSIARSAGILSHLIRVAARSAHTSIAFGGPSFHSGNRKQLARQLHREMSGYFIQTSRSESHSNQASPFCARNSATSMTSVPCDSMV